MSEEDIPRCPSCNRQLSYESSDGREVETMGGNSIEYLQCEDCECQYELINGNLYPF